MKKLFNLALVLMSLLGTRLFAQETPPITNEFNSWYTFTLQKKLSKTWHLFVTPEIRTNASGLDKYLLETGVRYKINKYLNTEITYRWTANQKDSQLTHAYRLALDLNGKTSLGRFLPEVRLRYTTESDFGDQDADQFLRYKAALGYNIPKSKLTPYVSGEAFHQLSDNAFTKMRYSIGADYKLSKRQSIGLDYKLDYYLNEYKNKHIIGLSYKLKL